MKSTLLAVCVMALFTGCSNGDKPEDMPATPAATTHTTANSGMPQVASVNSAIYDKFPDSTIRFNFPLTLLTDKTTTIQNGTTRRGLALAYKDIDADQLWESIGATFNKAGYRSTPLKTGELGKRSQSFVKSGVKAITISTAPNANKVDKGVMWASWEVPAADRAQ